MRNIIVFIISLFLIACTDNEQFRVNGTIEGKPNLTLRVAYYADGAYRTQVTAAREGKFEFFGSSKQPTLVEILDYDYRPLMRLYGGNGETFEIEYDRAHPLSAKISGNEVCERWSAFLADNEQVLMASPESANKTIADYVAAHPSDVVSTLLMATAYDYTIDAVAADSIMALIDPQARPSSLTESGNFMMQRMISEAVNDTIGPLRYVGRGDTVRIFDFPGRRLNLLAFSRWGKYRDDSIMPRLEKLSKLKNLRVIELDVDPKGTSQMRRSDTLAWTVGRMPGGIVAKEVDRLGIPSEPYFIVADSAGAQLLRTPYAGVAEDFVKKNLK